MIEALPQKRDPDERAARLRPVLDLVAARPASSRDAFIDVIKQRVGGTKKVLQAMLVEQLADRDQDAEADCAEEHAQDGFALTDLGNAERLHAYAGKLVRYVADWSCFLVFDGKLWCRDPGSHAVRRLAAQMVKKELLAAKKNNDPDTRQTLVTHWTRSQNRRALDNMVDVLKDQRGVCIELKRLDEHPYLVNFRNGTLDLKTRSLRPHEPAELLTKMIEHDYDPAAQCPNFTRYLEAAQPDATVREWLHRRDGFSLTADCSDQIFVVHYGAGGTGKGTRYRVLKHVLGDYVVKAPRSVFEAQCQRQHPADLMTLAG